MPGTSSSFESARVLTFSCAFDSEAAAAAVARAAWRPAGPAPAAAGVTVVPVSRSQYTVTEAATRPVAGTPADYVTLVPRCHGNAAWTSAGVRVTARSGRRSPGPAGGPAADRAFNLVLQIGGARPGQWPVTVPSPCRRRLPLSGLFRVMSPSGPGHREGSH